ncbi:MAG: 2-hydroxychromene-2-carboxylate isomerase [Polyangia bacterium]
MKTLEFFFDLASPYSYLAATQVEALCARTGANLEWKPMVLGAVFKAVGNTMPATVLPKARYMLTDLMRWARQYEVPFRMTSRFPVNALKPMRLIVAAEGLAKGQGPGPSKTGPLSLALFRALWVDDRDITTPEEMRAIAGEVGLDGEALLARAETPEVKDRLRAYTDEAIARGVFGAPALLVGPELFWGNDRLHFVEDALKGG